MVSFVGVPKICASQLWEFVNDCRLNVALNHIQGDVIRISFNMMSGITQNVFVSTHLLHCKLMPLHTIT